MSDTMHVFDRRLLRRRRDRAAPHWPAHDFLVREIGSRLGERLDDMRRSFPLALDLGCHGGTLAELLLHRRGIARIVQGDLSPAMARRAAGNGQSALALDEEALPFRDASFDLVVSALSLHWVNDLPGALLQLRRALRPDGLFLAALIGGDSLHQLRDVLLQAESETCGGVAARTSPLLDLRDGGALMQRSGFALPVVDLDEITVTYGDPLTLLRELRGMGESNALMARAPGGLRRDTLARAAALYAERFADADGRIPLTFQVIYLTGWAPDASQQQPLRPGSARHRLSEALGTRERAAGEAVRPPAGPQRER